MKNTFQKLPYKIGLAKATISGYWIVGRGMVSSAWVSGKGITS